MTEKNNGVVRDYYDEDKIKLSNTYYIFNGKKEGEYKEYWANEQLNLIRNYKNGNLEGEYKLYREDGQLNLICNYKNGNLEGKYKLYWEDGQLYLICNCKIYH